MQLRRFLVLLPVFLLFFAGCNLSPEAAKRKYLETGKKYYKNGKYKEASIMFRRAIQKDLKFGPAYYELGLTELQLKRYPEAVRALQRSIELDPKNTDAHAKLADFYLVAYATDRRRPPAILNEIREIADGLLKSDPRSYQGLRIRGLQFIVETKVKEAVDTLRQANSVRPMTRDVVLPLVQSLIADKQEAEGESVAKAMIAKDKEFGPVYDVLYTHYMRTNRAAEAEALLRQKADNNPQQAAFTIQLAGHYYGAQQRPEMLKTLERLTSNLKDFPNAYAMVGDFYFRIREFDQAVAQYQLGERAQPKEKLGYRKKIAEALIFANRRTEAIQVLDAVLKENPNDNESLAMRSSLRLQSGNREEIRAAVNDLLSVVRRNPENPVLRFEVGRAHVANGDFEQARLQFQEAVRLRSDYIPPRLAIAQIDISKGDFPRALQGADEILAIYPDNTAAKLIRSTSLIGMGDKIKARQELQETLKTQPGSRDANFQIGMLNFAEKQYKAADDAFRRLQTMSPPDPRGVLGLVEVQVAQGKFDAAIKLLEADLQQNPDRGEMRLFLANTAVRAKNYPLAIEHYKILLQKAPGRDDVYLRLGETYRRAGNLQAAIESVRKAAELNPKEAQHLVQLALLMDTMGDRSQARPVYEKALSLQPDNAIALNNLAFILAESGADLDRALSYAQKAKQKMPQDPNVADTLGWIYIKKNLSDNAIQIFQELLQQHPKQPAFRYHLGMALFQKGDKPGAKRELETALKNGPTKEDEAKIKELLGRIG